MNRFFVLILSLMISCSFAHGQEQRFFYPLSVESGMPHSEVTAIEDDASGFLWFGTYNGLARYDGYTLTSITKDYENDEYKSLRITSLYCDKEKDLLYIGTEEDGLKIMDLDTYKIVERFWFANSIYTICKGLNDEIWIGTERGVVRLTYTEGQHQYRYCESSLSKVADIIQTDEKTLMAAANSGIYHIDIHSGHTALITPGFGRALYKIDSESYLLGLASGLFIYNENEQERIRKIHNIDVYDIYRSADGRWWVGSIDSGLYRFSTNFSNCAYFKTGGDEGLPDNGIRAFQEDFSGNLWIGTQNGACKYYTRAEFFDFYAQSIDNNASESYKSNHTSSFWEDKDGRLWIGKYHSGLKILDRENSIVHSFNKQQIPELYQSTISCFFSDSDDNLWIGTWGGLYILRSRFIHDAHTYTRIPLIDFAGKHGLKGLSIFKIVCDQDGEYWFSTNNGLYRFRPSSDDIMEGVMTNHFPSVITTDMHIDHTPDNDKIVWLGTRNGLNKVLFKKDTTKPEIIIFEEKQENTRTPSGFISAVYSDSEDRLWILELDGSINLVTGGRRDGSYPSFQTMNINTEYTFDTAESLQEDNSGNLWIGGIRMMKFNPITWSCEFFDESDGLQNKSFKIWSSVKLSSGELVFGGVNGFSIFNPDKLQKNAIEPRVVLEELYVAGNRVKCGEKIKGRVILNQRVDLVSEIKLPYSHNNIAIQFAALHYTSPNKNRYRYMLEGHETSYKETIGNTHTATYPNLPAGTYTFRLEGSNSDGLWAEEAKTLKIRILPPVWQTVPAILLYILVALIIIYIIFKSIIQREKNKEQTRIYELKLKYFTDISHEIKTPLSLISSPIEDIYNSENLNPKTRQKLTLVRKNISRLMDLIEQIMDFNRHESDVMSLKLSQQDLINVCRTCMSYFEDRAERKDILFMFESNVKQIPVWVDRERIEKLLFNIIGNAFKFTSIGGSIIVKCNLRAKDVVVSICDSGTGIRPEALPHVFDRFYTTDKTGGSGIGLALAKAIVEQHHGKIWVESEYGRKTTFSFTLLLGDDHFSDIPKNFKIPYTSKDELSSYTIIREKNLAEDDLYNGRYISNEKSSILVVEDDFDMREYLKESLEQHFAITACSNGADALEAAKTQDFDCIVSDISMPIMDGVQLCIKAKQDILLSHIPIILLTAKDSVEDKISGFGAGADDYITKPFDMKLLITRISNIIKQRQDLKAKFHQNISVAPSMVTISSIDEQFMKQCLTLIEDNISDSEYNVEELCNDLSMSRPTVYKKIKSLTGLSVVAFMRSIRMKRAAQLLMQDGSSIKNIMYMVGFDNSSYFSARFKKEFGCTPNEFVEKHRSV